MAQLQLVQAQLAQESEQSAQAQTSWLQVAQVQSVQVQVAQMSEQSWHWQVSHSS